MKLNTHKAFLLTLTVLFLALTAAPLTAEVYKVVDKDGNVTLPINRPETAPNQSSCNRSVSLKHPFMKPKPSRLKKVKMVNRCRFEPYAACTGTSPSLRRNLKSQSGIRIGQLRLRGVPGHHFNLV